MRSIACAAALVLFVAWASLSASPDAAAVVEANNRFALKLYSRLASNEGNVFFSPYNIWTALALLYEGARGQTAAEMERLLGTPADAAARRAQVAALHARLQAREAYTLRLANALWADTRFPFHGDYLDVARRFYDARATNVDFQQHVDDARRTINAWVEQKTNDKIKNLFPSGSLGPDTRLVLTSAIYFKGQWIREFDKTLTRDEDFRAPGMVKKVPMMQSGPSARFRYGEDGDVQVLELPYKGNTLSMLVVLPKRDAVAPLESKLSLERLTGWRRMLSEHRVDVFLPKFTFTTAYSLSEALARLGMTRAFSDAADYSGLNATGDLKVGAVLHKAFVEVNEEGTEAAAATGAGIVEVTSLPPPVPVFRADHPFIFAIQESATGNLLFLGRVASPEA